MPQSTLQERVPAKAAAPDWGPGWTPTLIALIAGIGLLLALFLPEARAAVEVWNASTAYGHCYLVLPMTLYLLWERRSVLRAFSPQAEPIWALLAIPIPLIWLISERLGIMEGRQLMAVAAIELLFLVILGAKLFWQLSGPLAYLLFLVPFGAFLTPTLQHFTADFTAVGLDLLGIPHYADNYVIETPAGVFLVAEACAGLRFLIAAVAFGVFYALLNFTTPLRRAIFIVASIIVPIIANGFRALGIVVLGQILGSAEAAAADHIVYGWLFFSFVMLLLVAAGHPFRESAPDEPATRAALPAERNRTRLAWATAALLVLVACGPVVAAAIDRNANPVPFTSQPMIATPSGCEPLRALQEMPSATSRFELRCANQRFQITLTRYPKRSTAGSLVVDRRRITQELGAEDVSSSPLDAVPDTAGQWSVVQTSDPDRVTAIAVWVDGRPSAGGIAGRVAQAQDSLLGSDYAPIMMTISTPEPPRSSEAARRSIIQTMRSIVQAQPDLTAQMERLSRLP